MAGAGRYEMMTAYKGMTSQEAEMSRLLLKSTLMVMLMLGGFAPVSGADCVGVQCNIYRGAEYYGEPVLLPNARRELDEAKLPPKERNALKLMREKSRLRRQEMALQADIKRRAEQQRQWDRAAEQEKAREHAAELQHLRLRAQRQKARSGAARARQRPRRQRVFRQNRRHDRHPTIICSTVGGVTICQ